jgi:hypothetical protein
MMPVKLWTRFLCASKVVVGNALCRFPQDQQDSPARDDS